MKRRAAARAALLPAAGGALFLLAWRGGLPAFAHDWQISPDWQQYRSACAALDGFATRDNFGGPNPYAFVFPFALACRAAVLPLPSAAWLGVELFALGAFNAAGAAALLRALGVGSGFAAGLGAIVFVAGPLFANELAAGHLLYCWGSAGLAWAAAFTIRLADGGRPRDLCRAAAAWAVALVTIQFTLVLALVAAPALAAGRHRGAGAALLGLVAVLELPTVAIVTFADPAAFLHADRVTLAWERDLSTSLPLALSGFGYFAGYAEHAYGPLAGPLGWLRIAFLVAGAVAALRLRDGARCWALAAGLAGALLVSGLDGPIAAPLAFAFRAFPQAAVLRELYHFAALPALAVALAVATLAELPRGRSVFVAGGTVLALAGAWPFLTGGVLREVPRLEAREIAEWQRTDAAVRASGEPGALLFVPSAQPLGPALARSGADPEAFAIGDHPALYQFQPDPAVAWAIARYRAGDSETLARAGVAAAIVRPRWRSWRTRQALGNSMRALAAECAAEPAAGAGAPYVETFPARPRGWRTARPPADYAGLPASSLEDENPRHGWVDGTRWNGCFPALAELPTESRLTLSRRELALAPVPGRRAFLIWAPRGAVVLGAGTRRLGPTPHFVEIRATRGGRGVRVRGEGGPVAVTGWFRDGQDPFWWRSAARCARYAVRPQRVEPYVALRGAPALPDGTFPLIADSPGCDLPATRPSPLAAAVRALQLLSEGLFLVLLSVGCVPRARRPARS